MKTRLGVLFVVSALFAMPAAAQEDATSFLQAADAAMGASRVNSIHIAGAGWYAPLGQNFAPEEHWARLNLQSYDLTLDYNARASREEMVITQGDYPVRGGGRQPVVGERTTVAFVNGNDAWMIGEQGQTVAQPGEVEVRQFLIWTSPHGFIKAAQASGNATVVDRYFLGTERTIKVVGFTTMGKYRVTGEFDENNRLERVITWLPDPVMGDMQYEIRYTDYREIGDGIMFPFRYHAHRGDQFLLPDNFARNWMDYRVSEATPNVANSVTEAPAEVRGAQPQAMNVTASEIADGVWLMAGGSHNSVAIEFEDFITVVEAPLNDARSYAVIAEVKRRIPGKPIRYVVNTHHHFDHSGGLRNYVAEGARVITHESNEVFYNRVVFATQSRALSPDRLHLFPHATTGPTPIRIESMLDRHAVSDGNRTLMLFHVPNIQHSVNMLVAYLPEEGILINGDLYGPPQGDAVATAQATNGAIGLYRTIDRWNLEVTTHVPIHGQPGPHSDFERIVGPAALATADAGGEGG